MILDAIFGLFTGFLSTVIGLLPDFTAPVDLSSTNTAYDLAYKAAGLDTWIPIGTLVSVVGIIVVSLVVATSVRGILWLYGLLPGKAS